MTPLDDEQVLVRARLSARGRGSGIETSLSYHMLWSIRGGVVVSQRSFEREEDARRAASRS